MPLPDWTLLLRTPAFEVTALLLGLVVGSFANVCIHRLPLGQSIVSPPSRCPCCQALIRPRDNVPVLGWTLLRGRCRSCGEPISVRYPLVETTNGLLWLGLALVRGPSLQAVVSMIVVTALLILSLIAAKLTRILNQKAARDALEVEVPCVLPLPSTGLHDPNVGVLHRQQVQPPGIAPSL